MLLYKFYFVFVYFVLNVLVEEVSCEGSSLVFVIDDTDSMKDDIRQVKKEARAIFEEVLVQKSNEIKDFVLVTVNDPVSKLRVLKTKSPEKFLLYLDDITVGWGGDCPEYSMSGIQMALEESRPGSYIFVFTDASAKDYTKGDIVKRLCQQKQSQVIFVLTGDCFLYGGLKSGADYFVYQEIANVSSGQVFRVSKNEVHEVLKPIKILLGGKHSVIKSTTITSREEEPVAFTIDEKVEYALISVSGKDVGLRVRPAEISSPTPSVEKVMWNSAAKVLKVFNLNPGVYLAYVTGTSRISVMIYVRTDFTFEHGFSVFEPKSIEDTAKQPLADEPQYLSINVTDKENTVEIKSAILLNMDDKIISKDLKLTKLKNHFYITDLFISPAQMFKIKVKGVIKKTRETISRISKTAITPRVAPRMPETVPHTDISEGIEMYVDYGETATLTCKVNAHPMPTITWFTGAGTQLRSENSELEKPLYISYLKLKSIKKNEIYICTAQNKKGKQKSAIHVKVRPIFKTISVPKATTYAKYEDTINILCDIKSSVPITLKWFRSGTELSNSAMHSISADGTKLTLNSMDFGMEGKYTCEASLNEDPTVKLSYNTNVEMIGLEIPTTDISEGAKIYVDYGHEATLTCRVNAHPEPTITWFTGAGTQMQSETKYLEKPSYVSYLKLEHIKKNESYICRAVNGKGDHKTTIQVNVRPIFTIITVPEATTYAKYEDTVDILCDIKSSVPITLKWFWSGTELSNSAMHSISVDGTKLTLKSMDFGMEGKYTCEASLNEDPTVKQSYNTNVVMTGLVPPQITNAKRNLNGKRFTAICRFIGNPKPSIVWQFKPMRSDKFSQIQESGEEFIISDVKLENSGNYKCVVESRLGKVEETLELVVEEAPVITNTLTEYNGVVGDTVLMIPCNVTGYPDPVITWTKENKTADNEFTFNVDGHKLYISSLVPHKTVMFKCEAKNKLGTAEKLFSVEISDNYYNYDNNNRHVYHILEGNPVAIKCYVENSNASPVRWFLNGIPMDQIGNEYKIEKTVISNDGNYTCRINTAEGPKSENYELLVGTLPTFRNDAEDVVDWHDFTTLLNCEVNAKPVEKVEWSLNGERVKSLDNIDVVDVTDWGQYTCNVSNVHGSIQRTFKVISSGCYIRENKHKETPFMVTQDTLTWPDSISDNDVFVKERELLKLSCPSGAKSTNAFQSIPNKNVITAECVTQDQLIVDGKTYRYKDLQCETPVEPSIVNTHEQCAGPNSEIIEVGFTVNDFVQAYSVCYNKSHNVPLYVNIVKHLKQRGRSVKTSYFKWSSAPELGNGQPTENVTCEASQKCCYTKAQLLNVNEMPFGPAQAATFLDNLNSVSVWNPCDGDNRTSWETLVKAVKTESYNYQQWFYTTGASEFVNKNGGLVPRYLWKVINYVDDDEPGSVAMVYVNDKSPVESDIRCSKSCQKLVLYSDTDEYIYCCSLEEFRSVFGIDTSTNAGVF